jgi:hypothetical protein
MQVDLTLRGFANPTVKKLNPYSKDLDTPAPAPAPAHHPGLSAFKSSTPDYPQEG